MVTVKHFLRAVGRGAEVANFSKGLVSRTGLLWDS